MNTSPLSLRAPLLPLGACLVLVAVSSSLALRGQVHPANPSPTTLSINSVPVPSAHPSSPTNSAPVMNGAAAASTNAAPSSPGITITADGADDDDDNSGKKHSETINIGGNHEGSGWSMTAMTALLIPILGVVGVFGMPVLIVFVVCYFKYRRRQENLAMVREYLNKGLPVPPELLADSGATAAAVGSSSPVVIYRVKSDLRRGFTLASIGLGITLALYVDDPHSTDWGWGLIPLVVGIGYLLSGWVESRDRGFSDRNGMSDAPPPGNLPKP